MAVQSNMIDSSLSGCCTFRPDVGGATHEGGGGLHHKRLIAPTSAEEGSRSRPEPAFQPASTALWWTWVWHHRWPVAFLRSEAMMLDRTLCNIRIGAMIHQRMLLEYSKIIFSGREM